MLTKMERIERDKDIWGTHLELVVSVFFCSFLDGTYTWEKSKRSQTDLIMDETKSMKRLRRMNHSEQQILTCPLLTDKS